jgi:hypothetical protein
MTEKKISERIFKSNGNNFATIIPNIQIEGKKIESVNFTTSAIHIWFKDGSRVAYWLSDSSLGCKCKYL